MMVDTLIENELDLLASQLDLQQQRDILELGCGAAQFSRQLLERFPTHRITALEVDARQHAKNMLAPLAGLTFLQAGAQEIPGAANCFDLALMLKSLHHVPVPEMDQALAEIHRVLRPKALLYVSEPVFAGPLNEVMRVFHNEEVVRAAALDALRRAAKTDAWEQIDEIHFKTPVYFRDFAEFERRMIGVTYVNHQLDAATLEEVRARFEPSMTSGGAHFLRPMRVTLLRKQ